MNSQQFGVRPVEESNFVGYIIPSWIATKSFSSCDIPDCDCVVVLTTQRRQILLILRESQVLDQNFVEFQFLHDFESVEVPDDDIGIETHVCLLPTCDVFASV